MLFTQGLLGEPAGATMTYIAVYTSAYILVYIFFFQAEGGIRRPLVTGVQTCALPIFGKRHGRTPRQVALNFLTRDPHVFAIPKAGNVKHVRENSGGAGWELEERDIAE